jgi:DNA-directed RNA polymerase sigma subunit (sigma70/sigma32)
MARAVWRAVAQARPDPQELLTPHPPQKTPDLGEQVETALIHQALYHLVASLPHPLRFVIVARYGLDSRPPHTFAAIGHALGLTRQRAHQLHSAALLWLAHPARSLALRQLLDRNTVAHYQAYLARQRRWQRARRKKR